MLLCHPETQHVAEQSDPTRAVEGLCVSTDEAMRYGSSLSYEKLQSRRARPFRRAHHFTTSAGTFPAQLQKSEGAVKFASAPPDVVPAVVAF